jgi:PhoPQ-activated pathogenicity-related protein
MTPLSTHRRKRPSARPRSLAIEPLEERQLLDAAPWQNPEFRFDVNNNSFTTPADALVLINRIRTTGGGEVLPAPGPNPPQYYYDTNGDNNLTPADLVGVVTAILSPPQVVVSSMTHYTPDVTPLVTVTAAGTPAIPDGTVLDLDVDLNHDGDFGDPGESGYTQSTFFAGSSTFQITPALERTDELYTVNLRARVKNSNAVVGNSPMLPLGIDTATSDALANYVNTFDPSYTYTTVAGISQTYYLLDMTSQTWRSSADVNLPVWHHWLEVYLPSSLNFNTALMLIDGGSNTSGPPSQSPELAEVAQVTGSVVVNLKIVPNEPVIFTDETRSRTEDDIIAYTFDKYMENMGQPGNETWPLLLPMVKSAVRAMDTVQAFVPTVKPGSQIHDFVVFGGSKRGWTTWLTAAVDDRVRAIMPGVIDVLNTAPQMLHHYGVYGFFSYAIDAYQNMQIFDRMLTPEARELFRIVDPYHYLANGRFDDMPKFVVNSAGDEFFVSDSAQFYYDDIPGDLNRLRYIPNTSHGLDLGPVFESVVAFYGSILFGFPIPDYSWTVAQDGSIHVQTPNVPSQVLLWQATNPEVRDFRHEVYPNLWTSSPAIAQGGGIYMGDVPIPAEGATAYFVELTFPTPIPGISHVFTTEIRVKTNLPLYPWPFETETGAPIPAAAPHIPATAGVSPGAQAAAVAIAIESDVIDSPLDAPAAGLLPPAADQPSAGPLASNPDMLMEPTEPALAAAGDPEAVDHIFGSTSDELLD